MEFCPECGSMLLPTEDNELKCSCGYTKKLSKDKSEYNVNEKIKENDSVIEKGEDVAKCFEHCIEFAEGDSALFTNELNRLTKDTGPFIPNKD